MDNIARSSLWICYELKRSANSRKFTKVSNKCEKLPLFFGRSKPFHGSPFELRLRAQFKGLGLHFLINLSTAFICFDHWQKLFPGFSFQRRDEDSAGVAVLADADVDQLVDGKIRKTRYLQKKPLV